MGILDKVLEIKKEYRKVMEKINALVAYEFIWDYTDEEAVIPMALTVVNIQECGHERMELLIEVINANGILVTQDDDGFCVDVIAENKEEAEKIAKDIYNKKFLTI